MLRPFEPSQCYQMTRSLNIMVSLPPTHSTVVFLLHHFPGLAFLVFTELLMEAQIH